MIVLLSITFLTKLRISEIQINDEDKPLDDLINDISWAMRRRKIICFSATLIFLIYIINDAVEEFYYKKEDT